MTPPDRIRLAHPDDDFSGIDVVGDAWARAEIARARAVRGVRTFVAADTLPGRVKGRYWLAPHFVESSRADGELPRPSEMPIPVVLICELAVDSGRLTPDERDALLLQLLKDSVARALGGASRIGARALLAYGGNPAVVPLLQRFGFVKIADTTVDGMYLPLAATTHADPVRDRAR